MCTATSPSKLVSFNPKYLIPCNNFKAFAILIIPSLPRLLWPNTIQLSSGFPEITFAISLPMAPVMLLPSKRSDIIVLCCIKARIMLHIPLFFKLLLSKNSASNPLLFTITSAIRSPASFVIWLSLNFSIFK